MASFAYDSFEDDVHRGNIDCDTDTFYVLLTTSSYTENQGSHTKRSDITNEVTGTGYTAGGASVTVTVTKDTSGHKITLSLGGASWASSTVTARKAAYYKRRGGLATADELVAVNDFGSDVISTAGTFTLNASTVVINTPV